jgi:predicted amidophosphoribosyltransferase
MTKQPRERAVPCSRCMKPTWNNGAVCDRCLGGVDHRTQLFAQILKAEIEKNR